ncbi:MAG: transposase, partial [Actinobacteria bacterium]|nr:transposase [Actinomycetota bacterium]
RSLNYRRHHACKGVGIHKLKLSGLISVSLEGRSLNYTLDEEALKRQEALDGCYVITTEISKDELTKEEVHARYKDLYKIESAFRSMKTCVLEVRPLYHRKAKRTRAHVFVVALSYLLLRYLKDHLIDVDIKQGLYLLDAIQINPVKIKDLTVRKIQIPDNEQSKILDALDVKLPLTAILAND